MAYGYYSMPNGPESKRGNLVICEISSCLIIVIASGSHPLLFIVFVENCNNTTLQKLIFIINQAYS